MGMRRFALDLDVAIFMLLMADAGVVTFLRGVDADAATFCRARHLPAPLRGIVINIGIGRLLRRQCLGLRGGISLKRQRELCDDLGVEKGLEAGQFEEDREARQYPTSVSKVLRKNPPTKKIQFSTPQADPRDPLLRRSRSLGCDICIHPLLTARYPSLFLPTSLPPSLLP